MGSQRFGETAARQGVRALESKAEQTLMAIIIPDGVKRAWMEGFIATLETEFPKLLQWARNARTDVGR